MFQEAPCSGADIRELRCSHKLLLQKFPQFLFSLQTKMCSRSLHLAIGRTKSVADCGTSEEEAYRFLQCGHCAVRHAWPPVFTVPVSRNFLNSLLTPRYCQAFLRKFICQPLRCVPLQLQTLDQNIVLVA